MYPNAGALADHRLFESPMMIGVDPPDHGRSLRLVNRGFTPRRIAALEPRLREIASGYVDAVAGRGEMDLQRDLAIPFPVTVIAELLGVDTDRIDQFSTGPTRSRWASPGCQRHGSWSTCAGPSTRWRTTSIG
jgi:cytochrome P450